MLMWGRNNSVFITSSAYRDDIKHEPGFDYYDDPEAYKLSNGGADHVGSVNMA